MSAAEVLVIPAELVESENLVVRQARAVVIASDADYDAAMRFLNDVVVPGRAQVDDLFDPHVKRAFDAHRALTTDRAKHAAPWDEAFRLVKAAAAEWAAKRRKAIEDAEAERRATAARLAREQAEADAKLAREQAERDAAERRAKAEADRLHAMAAAASQTRAHEAKKCDPETCGLCAADRAAAEAEAEAKRIEAEGQQTAAAIIATPAAVELPAMPVERLKGSASTWKCDRDAWDRVAFIRWLAEDPEGRAKYLSDDAPNWSILDPEAKAQKNHFLCGGITARPVTSVRAGGRSK